VLDAKPLDLTEDLLDAEAISLGLPRSIRGIAKPAPEIAAARSDENTRRAGQKTFTLNTLENLGNPEQTTTLLKRLGKFGLR